MPLMAMQDESLCNGTLAWTEGFCICFLFVSFLGECFTICKCLAFFSIHSTESPNSHSAFHFVERGTKAQRSKGYCPRSTARK